MNDLPKLSLELIALTYLHLVKRHACASWQSDQGTQLMAALAQVCADYDIDPLSDPLIDRLAYVHAEPRDRYMVTVVLAASALWERDAGFALLTALIPLHDPGGAGQPGPGSGAGAASWPQWRANGAR